MTEPCPGCGELHEWRYGEPINGIPVVLCSNVPPDKIYMLTPAIIEAMKRDEGSFIRALDEA